MKKPNVPLHLLEHTESMLFVRAVIEDSPVELEWLWLAAQLDNIAEKQFCYQQALYINPKSVAAQRGLHQIQKRAQRAKVIDRISNALEFLVVRSALAHLSIFQK